MSKHAGRSCYNLSMILKLTPEQREALAHADSPTAVQLVDPQANVAYVLLRADLYERFRDILDTLDADETDIRAAYPLMDAAARAAGWDDPAEDIYDDLDPRRTL